MRLYGQSKQNTCLVCKTHTKIQFILLFEKFIAVISASTLTNWNSFIRFCNYSVLVSESDIGIPKQNSPENPCTVEVSKYFT